MSLNFDGTECEVIEEFSDTNRKKLSVNSGNHKDGNQVLFDRGDQTYPGTIFVPADWGYKDAGFYGSENGNLLVCSGTPIPLILYSVFAGIDCADVQSTKTPYLVTL